MKMKFLEGKSPSERKKIIAALVLGVVTVCALFYTFVLSGGSTSASKTGVTNSNRPSGNSNSGTTRNTPKPNPDDVVWESIDHALLTPIPDNPFPPISGGETSRNIFAFYEPLPPQPRQPAPIPEKTIPTPTPAPPPPILVSFVNPSQVYAQTGNFQLEVAGDKFTPETKVYFGGREVPTQFVNPQRLTAQIPADLVSSDGPRQITVRVPNDEKLFSNVAEFNIQPPPVPEFAFVGLVARKRNNNDTALLQNKKTKEYISVRLNDPVPDRFRVFSISTREVVVVDTALKLRHSLPFLEEKDAARAGSGAPVPNRPGVRSGNQTVINPSVDPNVQFQSIPGIPDNIPRYVPPQPVPPPQPGPPSKTDRKDKDRDDDDDPNR